MALTTPKNPICQGIFTDRSGTVAVGGTAQTVATVNLARKAILIYNPSSASGQGIATAESLWFNFTASAVLTQPSIELQPGIGITFDSEFVTTELISVIAATTSHAFIIKEA